MTFPELAQGDIIQVEWCDITEDSVGSVSKASLARRHSLGLFHGLTESQGLKCLVTTNTIDKDVEDQSGYTIYPVAVVLGIKVIKRARRKKAQPKKVEPAE